MTTTITVCPDPAGTPRDTAGAVSYTLAFSPDGTHLAQVYQRASTNYDPMRLAVYRRDGDQLTLLAAPQLDPFNQGQPTGCVWHPSGTWLIVSTIPGSARPYTYTDGYKLWVYRLTGDTITLTGSSDHWLYGDYQPGGFGQLAFDATGRYLACATAHGFWGLVTFDPAGGAFESSWGLYDTSGADARFGTPMVHAAAWHPTDTTLLAYLDAAGQLGFRRRGGQTLPDAGLTVPATSATGLAWHPSGDYLITDDQSSGGTYGLMCYSYDPVAFQVALADFPQVTSGFTFDPAGVYLAGGPAVESDPYGGCGYGGTYLGLTVDEVSTGGGSFTTTMLDRPAVPVGGQAVAFTAGTAGSTYLASATASWADPATFGPEPWGVRLYRLDAAATSSLYMRQPDGTYRLVGTADQPVSFRLPDGSLRTWPGSGYPLYQRQGDGTWKKVLG